MILILSSPEDVHARRVAQEIELLGHSARFLNWREAGKGLRASLNYIGKSIEFLIQTEEDKAIRLDDVRSIWTRRPGPLDTPLGVINNEHRRFALQEWRDFLDGLMLSCGLDSLAINPLSAQRDAVKPYQLTVAQRIGLRVPKTLISSDPRRVADFVDANEGRIVHKTMTSLRNAFMDTRKWQETDRSALNQLLLAPTIFQEFIEGRFDIRATIVGQEIYAATIDTAQSRAGIDSRLDLDVPTTPYEVPNDIALQLHALMDTLNLKFATVDLKIDKCGQVYFLELNPQGQFLYIEILTGLPIAAAMAKLLVRGEETDRKNFTTGHFLTPRSGYERLQESTSSH